MAASGKNAIHKVVLGNDMSIRLSKYGPSTTILVLIRKKLFRNMLTDVDT